MLTIEQKTFYKENGFIKLSNIFTPAEIQTISDEYDELFARKQGEDMEATWKGELVEKESNQTPVSVLSIHNLQFHSGVFSAMLTHPRLLDALQDVMGTPDILLHHTKAHLKPPHKGAPFPMHQDYHYFPYEKDSMVAVFLHLDDTTPENGGLAVYPGSHKLGPQEDKGVQEKGGVYHYLDQDKFPLSKATPIAAEKGEVVIFSYLLIHGSFLNTSQSVRRMFLMQVMSADDEPISEKHRSPGQGTVLRGRNVKRDARLANRHADKCTNESESIH